MKNEKEIEVRREMKCCVNDFWESIKFFLITLLLKLMFWSKLRGGVINIKKVEYIWIW